MEVRNADTLPTPYPLLRAERSLLSAMQVPGLGGRKPIEEIIKVNNLDEQTVYTELTEYIATDRIKDHYRRLLKAIVDAKSTPTEGIGVWISGFFGSGKSSFAKNLGYVLANRTVLGKPASALFAKQLNDTRIAEYRHGEARWERRLTPGRLSRHHGRSTGASSCVADPLSAILRRQRATRRAMYGADVPRASDRRGRR